MSETSGSSLVRYRVVERIARSPQDARYLVQHLDRGTLAELRVLSGDLGASPGLVRAFSEHAERVASAARDCSGIATVHECKRVARGALLVTVERPDGPTLLEVLQAEGPLAIPRAVRVAIQIAEALEPAHGLGLVHGGLHPDNVVLGGPNETVSLTHFGFDRLLGSPGRGAHRPHGIDDRVYQAPEQASGWTTARSDVYALGVLLHEMLAGVPPSMPSRRRTGARALREQRSDVPRSLERLVMRALHPVPRRRPASISAMCTELWAEVSHHGRPTLPDRSQSWPAAFLRRPVLLAGAVLTAGALTAAAGGAIVRLGLMGSAAEAPAHGPAVPARRAEPLRAIPMPPEPRDVEPRAPGPGDSDTRRGSERSAARSVPAERAAMAPSREAAQPPAPLRPAEVREVEPAPRRPAAVRVPEPEPAASRPAPPRDTGPPREGSPPREASEDPGAIIDWLIGEGARQRR